MNTNVFISHASEDKERFVLEFSERLRSSGVNAWLDKWEILPGDSLVDKLFEDGLKTANAVVIVLSNTSINKPWVKEELNASVVKKIKGECKIIPVVIDDCTIPECLTSIVWIKIQDLTNYDDKFKEILNSIFDNREKPPLGEAPMFAREAPHSIEGLNELDSRFLRIAYECLQTKSHVDSTFLNEIALKKGLLESDFHDSAIILEGQGLIKITRLNKGSFLISKTTQGSILFYKSIHPNFDELVSSVISAIVNKNIKDSSSMYNEFSEESPYMIAEIIYDLHERNLLKSVPQGATKQGPRFHVYESSPRLKRMLK